MTEWAARTYGWQLYTILWVIPAVHVALLFRQWRFAVAGSQAITLMEEERFKQGLKNG